MLEDFVPYPCLSLPYFPSFLLPPGKFGSSGLRETFAAQIPQAPALGLTFPIPTPSPSQLEKFQGCACCFLAGLGLHTCPAQRKNSGFPKMLWLSASTPLPAFSLSVPYLFPPIPCLLLVPALPPPKATPEVLPGTFLLAGMVTAHPGHACRMLASGKGLPGGFCPSALRGQHPQPPLGHPIPLPRAQEERLPPAKGLENEVSAEHIRCGAVELFLPGWEFHPEGCAVP